MTEQTDYESMPSDIVEETRAAREHGGTGMATVVKVAAT